MSKKNRERLYRYIWSILKKRNCHLYRINGTNDHIHILTDLHPSISLADLVKEIKLATSHWIKENRIFSKFEYWQDGYGAFTHSISEKDVLIEYIKNQEEHHRAVSFHDEFKRLLIDAGIEFNEKYIK